MQENCENEKIEIYEIENKKYRVITKCIENTQSVDKLYNILCKFAVNKLNSNV